jgi:hypothetical protein
LAEPIIIIKESGQLKEEEKGKNKTVQITFSDGKGGKEPVEYESDLPLTGSEWYGKEAGGKVKIERKKGT